MRVNHQHTGFFHSASIALCLVLLLLSPCKLRNFIQDQIGVETTEATNKSKATLSPASCVAFEEVTATTLKNDSAFQKLAVLPTSVSAGFYSTEIKTEASPLLTSQILRNVPVPLYILYQNFKDHPSYFA